MNLPNIKDKKSRYYKNVDFKKAVKESKRLGLDNSKISSYLYNKYTNTFCTNELLLFNISSLFLIILSKIF